MKLTSQERRNKSVFLTAQNMETAANGNPINRARERILLITSGGA
jgi:hypothetical protein